MFLSNPPTTAACTIPSESLCFWYVGDSGKKTYTSARTACASSEPTSRLATLDTYTKWNAVRQNLPDIG